MSSPPSTNVRPHGSRRRPLLAVGVAVAVAVVAGLVATWALVGGDNDRDDDRDDARAPPSDAVEASGWEPIEAMPVATPNGAVAAWTGTEVLVFDGLHPGGVAPRVGAGYDVARNTWRVLSEMPAAVASGFQVVWAEGRLLVLGAEVGRGDEAPRSVVLAYDPAADRWTTSVAPTPAFGDPVWTNAVWGGGVLYAWLGGDSGRSGPGPDPRFFGYRPASDEWHELGVGPFGVEAPTTSVWTGDQLLAIGSSAAAEFEPASGRWLGLQDSPASFHRTPPAMRWTGSEVVVVGYDTLGVNPAGPSAAFDPATDGWRPLPEFPQRGATTDGLVVWTGRELVVVETDFDAQTRTASGLLATSYDPAGDVWGQLPEERSAPKCLPTAAEWTGSELVVLGFSDCGLALVTSAYRLRL